MSEFPKPIDLARRVLAIETTAIDTVILARAVIAQDEELTDLRRKAINRRCIWRRRNVLEVNTTATTSKATACPCHHTTPCSDMCSCARPLMSAGCRRCASYGSEEQRQGAARRLAALDEDLERLRAALIEALDALESVEIQYDVAVFTMTYQRIAELREMARTR